MMLARLNVRQKLTLLLLLPLIAVALTSVPFAVGQINSAVSAGATVGVAGQARTVGVLVQDLQEERLLALAFLATSETEQDAYVLRVAATDDEAATVDSGLQLPRDVKIKSAVGGLGVLTTLRASVLRRTAEPATVYRTYHTVVVALIDALRLTQQDDADATGIRQMNTLDALLRTNEEVGRIGAALVLSSTDASSAVHLVEEALLLRTSAATRFRQQADAEENTLINLVQQGPTGRRVDRLAKQLSADKRALPLTESLSAAQTIITLTRVQQERIARDIADRAAARASNARLYAGTIIGLATLLVGVVILLSMAVSRSVSGPLRRLTAAATQVADIASAELVRVADSESDDIKPPNLTAVEVQTADEIGEMAAAFNRVQLTAAKLMEQQLASRRNTAVMFANIARRTRSMVSRQLTYIDDLERNEQNERLLAKLYRLDHLTTRLHRSADSLLVVSGAREDERIVAPAPLPEVVRSAVAEIEGYQNVQVGSLTPVTIAPQLVPDLRLVLAEVLENATAFSPPGSAVEVSAAVEGPCRIFIVDHGIGMTDDRLAEENRRLVERERLDIVPTSVLGLFVVGRLARRHGLTVQLSHTAEQGITATVTIPIGLFMDGSRPAVAPAQAVEPDAPLGAAPSAATIEVLSNAQALAAGMLAQPQTPPQPVQPVAQPVQPVQPVAQPVQPVQSVAQPVQPVQPVAQPMQPVAQPVQSAPPVAPQVEPVRPPAVPPMPQPVTAAAPVAPPAQPPITQPPMTQPPVAQPPVVEPPVVAHPVVELPAVGPTFVPPAMQRPAVPPVDVPVPPAPMAPAAPPVFQAPVPAAAAPLVPEPATPPPPVPGVGTPDGGLGWFVPPPKLPTTPAIAEPRVGGPPVAGPQSPVAPVPQVAAPPVPPVPPTPVQQAPPSSPRHAEPDSAVESRIHRGLTRRKPGGHLPDFGFGSDDVGATPVTRDAVAERAELEAFALGTAQAAAARLKRSGMDIPEPTFTEPMRQAGGPAGAPAAAAPVGARGEAAPVAMRGDPVPVGQPAAGAGNAQPSSRGGLTRRLPGSHLSTGKGRSPMSTSTLP